MISVNFYDLKEIQENKLKYVVIVAKYKDKWIMVKHKKRKTWEVPGGHIEDGEGVEEAAKRELFEETGAKEVQLKAISIYSVCRTGENESFGQLYFGQVNKIEQLPESEIGEVKLFDKLPKDLTYPSIQPKLYKKVLEYLE
ncbi:NUDIX hydrolase [Dethiothermospora halolimnae]|uniref:NUDIX hydrolase n=1 Tax=Dethiothermospora halolimnae TaxID=3114390 RepID=UPI003CCB77C6